MDLRRALRIACFAAIVGAVELNATTREGLVDYLIADYDPTLPPGRLDKALRNVGVSYFLESLYGVDQIKGSYWVDFSLRLYWNDPRLAWGQYSTNIKNPPGSFGLRLERVQDQIWLPDVVFTNVMTNHRSPTSQFDSRLIVLPHGDVLWNRKFVAEMRCPMDFRKFPFDNQTCIIGMVFWATSVEDAVLVFQETDGDTSFEGIRLNEWHEFSQTKVTNVIHASTGNFAGAEIRFHFTRIPYFWVTVAVIPAILFVLISQAGAFIDPAWGGRINFAVLCFLCVFTNCIAVTKAMPPVSYEVWAINFIFGCACFNVMSLFSMLLSNFARSKVIHKKDAIASNLESQQHVPRSKLNLLNDRMLQRLFHADWYWRLMFVPSFACFLIIMFATA